LYASIDTEVKLPIFEKKTGRLVVGITSKSIA
jgi:hypothetical protein